MEAQKRDLGVVVLDAGFGEQQIPTSVKTPHSNIRYYDLQNPPETIVINGPAEEPIKRTDYSMEPKRLRL
jgi:hypothetical protein